MKATRYKLYYPLENEKYLLINTLTGALDIVEDDVIRYLNNLDEDKEEKNISEELIKALKDRGYIINENKDVELLKRLFNFCEDSNDILDFTICPTYSCNLRCPYCFENNKVKNQEKVLSNIEIDKIFEVINSISNERNIKRQRIQLFGGEPFQLTTKDSVKYIFEKAEEINATVLAITNGTNLELFKDILSENKQHIDYIQITLDGTKELHDKSRISLDNKGSFDKICNNIKLILDIGIQVVVRVNVGKANIKCLKSLMDFYENEGWTKYNNFICQLTPITDHRSLRNVVNWMPENEILKEINNQVGDIEYIKKRYKIVLGTDMERRTKLIRSIWNKSDNKSLKTNPCACGAGSRIYYVFGADGKIYPCPETVGEEEHSIGKYYPNFELDKNKDMQWKRNVTNIDDCTKCNIAPLCGSACVWSSIATNGILFEKPVCNYAKETIDDYFEINKKRICESLER